MISSHTHDTHATELPSRGRVCSQSEACSAVRIEKRETMKETGRRSAPVREFLSRPDMLWSAAHLEAEALSCTLRWYGTENISKAVSQLLAGFHAVKLCVQFARY